MNNQFCKDCKHGQIVPGHQEILKCRQRPVWRKGKTVRTLQRSSELPPRKVGHEKVKLHDLCYLWEKK